MRFDGLIASLWQLDDIRSTNAGGNDDSRSVHVNNDDYVSTDTSGDETTADVPADGLFALKRPLPELSHYFYTRQLCLHLILTLCFWTPPAAVLPSLHSVCPSSMRAGASSLTESLVMPFSWSIDNITVADDPALLYEPTNEREPD